MPTIDKLASLIATRRCVLFAGSGLTVRYGGATWTSLIQYLKEKFNYNSPLSDKFQIMGDIGREFGYEKVYNAVVQKLKNVSLEKPVVDIAKFPWHTVFTTNYDTALENALENNQTLSVQVINRGEDFPTILNQSKIHCVKLMGSLDIPYGQKGSMILDPGDYSLAREERSRIFDILTTYAANTSILFIGYSFDDNLFIEILERLRKTIGQPDSTYYAVFQEEPDGEKKYLLKKYNVEIIVEDLEIFASKLVEKVTLYNPKDYSKKRILIGEDVLEINSIKIDPFSSIFEPVFFNEMEEDVQAEPFLKGKTNSFKPFNLAWNFPRKETDEIIKKITNRKIGDDKPNIIRVEGNPGTGRSFIILAAINKLIREHRAIAIKIPNYSYKTIPSIDELRLYLDEIFNSIKMKDLEVPNLIVLWSEFQLDDESISLFKKLSKEVEIINEESGNFSIPINLIYEDNVSYKENDEAQQEKEIISINVVSDLSLDMKQDLAKYILRTIKAHKLIEISGDELVSIITKEKNFLPIMFRTLDPTRRSIQKIINETFNEIKDPEVRALISICSLSSSIDIDIPVAVIKRALSKTFGRVASYPEIFQLASTEAGKSFIVPSERRSNPLFSIYHSYIAQHICKLIGTKKLNEFLLDIADTVELKSRIEGEFISNLLILKGVNWKPSPYQIRPFSDVGLEKAFSHLIHRQPARPLLHHFARLYHKKDMNDKSIELLKEALAEPKEKYSLEERKENIMVTLANIQWDQKKEKLISKPREDSEIQGIIDMLIKSRENNINIHSYDVHVKILIDLIKNYKNFDKKISLMNEALEVISEGLDEFYSDPDSIQRLNERQMEVLLEIDPEKAKNIAEDLLKKKNDGTGYYYIGLYEYNNNIDNAKAIEYLDKAINSDNCPPGAIALRIEIDLIDSFNKNPDYEYLYTLVNKLNSDTNFRDNWKTAYLKAVIYTINGNYRDAHQFFTYSRRKAPRIHQARVRVFWMEQEHRKMFNGKIGRILTEREGSIYSHGIEGWDIDIYFDPRRQELCRFLESGLIINFELGFNPIGPIAFDVRPSKIKSLR